MLLGSRIRVWLIVIVLGRISLAMAVAQSASGRVYEFLGLPATARITALGGYAFPDLSNDLGMAQTFPALLNSGTGGQLHMNVADYFDDIHYGTMAYAWSVERWGSFSASVQYIRYGRFIETDDLGQILGEFTAGEYGLRLGWGRQLADKLFLGSNLSSIHSYLSDYRSWGLAADVSLVYLDKDRQLAFGLAARHMGVQITRYREGPAEPLPFDLQLAMSKKLENAPIRLSAVYHNLHRFDLTYPQRSFVGSLQAEENSSGPWHRDIPDKLMRHIVLGLEFIPNDVFSARMGYNYRRRQEMKVDSRLSTVGFSWGVGLRVAGFQLGYGRANHHLAGAPNHFTVAASISDLFRKSGSLPETL